jgi:hypothetical protein
MVVWLLRLLGIAIVLVAGYLTYLASHEAAIALLCLGGAAAICVLCLIFLWDRPQIGSPIAAVVLIAGIVAHLVVVPHSAATAPSQSLGSAFSSSVPAPAPAASTSSAALPTPQTGPTPSSLPSLQPATGVLSAPQPGNFDYSYFIGHGTIDDGMPSPTYSQETTHAVGAAAAAFGGATPTPIESVTAQKLLDTDAQLPESEYSLPALAQTLPDDPVAIYRFVRDNIAIDPYDGIMRGPLGAWLSRAGSPSDKLSLLAWLLVNKHIHIQFVRGTLSADERNQIVQSATTGPDDNTSQQTEQGGSNIDAMTGAYVRDGMTFAQWSSRQLASAHIALGSGNAPQVSSKHYWIQIDQNGKLLDLDPTLPSMSEGQHLGSLDPTFKPWAMLPSDEYHYVRIMLTATYADGTQQQVIAGIGETCNLAYTPIRLALLPVTGNQPSDVANARKFNVWLVDGSSSLTPEAQLDLDAHGGIARVVMEIDRKDTDGRQITSTRNLLSPGTPQRLQGPALAGLTSMVIVPGLGLNAFEFHVYIRTMAAVANAIEGSQNGRMKPPPVYPIPLAEFFARDESVIDQLAQATNGRFYRDRPNIVLERTWYRMDQGTPRAVLGFDIVDNGMAAVGIDASQAALANLARGYADEEIERDVIHGSGTQNTIAVFNAAGINPVVVSTAGSAGSNVGNLADGLSETLGSGHVAIAPDAAVTVSGKRVYGWWDVDPSTGSTVGRMTGGAGQEMTAYSFLLDALGSIQAAAEMADESRECAEDASACAAANCANLASTALLARTFKHALHHIKSWQAVVGALVQDAVLATLTTGFCHFTLGGKPPGGGEGGGHGGEGGGAPPPENGPPYGGG